MTAVDDLFSYLTLTNLLLFISCTLVIINVTRRKSVNLPPGPLSLPLVGSLPFMKAHAEETFAKWSQKYGPVISVNLGTQFTVVLNSSEAITEAFVNQGPKFNGRYHTFFTNLSSGNKGIMFIEGEEWKTQRKFGIKALTGAGLHGQTMEARVRKEATALCEVIKSKNGKPFILEKELMKSVANIIVAILVKEHCDHNNDITYYVERMIENFRQDGLAYMMLSIAPWCRFFPPFNKNLQNILKAKAEGDVIFNKIIDDHKKHLDPNHPRDFTDLYLIEQLKNTESFQQREQLVLYLKELFAAGIETSTSTLRWIILYLIRYPEVQKKVHEEIDEAIGRDGKVKYDLDLPYTKAVIQEAFRIRPVTPLGVPRKTSEAVKILGYTIPKNTQVLPNIWFVHNDPSIWPNPEEFNPSRHLDKEGRFVKLPNIIPFSTGSRNCLGENLARVEIFILFVTMLQKFEVCDNPEQPFDERDLKRIVGIVESAPHYPLIMRER